MPQLPAPQNKDELFKSLDSASESLEKSSKSIEGSIKRITKLNRMGLYSGVGFGSGGCFSILMCSTFPISSAPVFTISSLIVGLFGGAILGSNRKTYKINEQEDLLHRANDHRDRDLAMLNRELEIARKDKSNQVALIEDEKALLLKMTPSELIQKYFGHL